MGACVPQSAFSVDRLSCEDRAPMSSKSGRNVRRASMGEGLPIVKSHLDGVDVETVAQGIERGGMSLQNTPASVKLLSSKTLSCTLFAQSGDLLDLPINFHKTLGVVEGSESNGIHQHDFEITHGNA